LCNCHCRKPSTSYHHDYFLHVVNVFIVKGAGLNKTAPSSINTNLLSKSKTAVLLKNQMTTVNRKAEEEILAVDGADADIVLLIGLTVIANHDALHITR